MLKTTAPGLIINYALKGLVSHATKPPLLTSSAWRPVIIDDALDLSQCVKDADVESGFSFWVLLNLLLPT